MRRPEIECLCGGREDDIGQPIPRTCHACGAETMGLFSRRRHSRRAFEETSPGIVNMASPPPLPRAIYVNGNETEFQASLL
jgi:hypothetical protein